MREVIVDPRDNFVRRISLNHCRSILKPHLVFVCGGEVDLRETQKNLTIRNMFMNCAGNKSLREFILAEDFKDWQKGYSDLSAFENDIASISSLVAIILESPGALAELGLFYANEEIRQKLIVVVHSEHYESASFIKFGLLDPLEGLDPRFVLPFDIDPENIEKISKDEVKDIVDEIDEFCSSIQETEKFDRSHRGHQIFLIFQIIDLFLALTKTEIFRYLELLGISISKKNVTAALFILEKFGQVEIKKRSSQSFYFATKGASARIEFKAEPNKGRIDKASIKIEVGEFFRLSAKTNRSDQNRIKLIEVINKTGFKQ